MIKADKRKFTRITTKGRKIMPRNRRKYNGCVSQNGNRWRSRFSGAYKYLGCESHDTKKEAVAFIKEVNIIENLPVRNVIYKYKSEYYCVLTKGQLMKFSKEDRWLVEAHTWHANYNGCTKSYYAMNSDGHSYPQLIFSGYGHRSW